ncbi:MAG: tRNA (adenosine(37)-N6)-threonylcarbamoyltransferase complex ATPase subunit type 1 TsaE [Alicyclobacillus sp.]|nr:tRNA (adenosine(37)-N6)-threonylcarbamoyltransferase complex ATPase subunit type 1 TsaE [Alicyclobacillus sp.]
MVDSVSIRTLSPEQTRRVGQKLGELLQPGDVVLLTGDVGAGKTTFCQGVAVGAGIGQPLTSPTFTLAAEYTGRVRLVHADLYRLHDEAARSGRPLAELLLEMGWEDELESDAVLLVEWPGAAADGLDALAVELVRAPLPRLDERELRCRATGKRSKQRLDEWVKRWLF